MFSGKMLVKQMHSFSRLTVIAVTSTNTILRPAIPQARVLVGLILFFLVVCQLHMNVK